MKITGWDILFIIVQSITIFFLASYTVLYHRGSVLSVIKEAVTRFIRMFKKNKRE